MDRLLNLAGWLGSEELEILARRGLLRAIPDGPKERPIEIPYEPLGWSLGGFLQSRELQPLDTFTSYWMDIIALFMMNGQSIAFPDTVVQLGRSRNPSIVALHLHDIVCDFLVFGGLIDGDEEEWMSESTKRWILCLLQFLNGFVPEPGLSRSKMTSRILFPSHRSTRDVQREGEARMNTLERRILVVLESLSRITLAFAPLDGEDDTAPLRRLLLALSSIHSHLTKVVTFTHPLLQLHTENSSRLRAPFSRTSAPSTLPNYRLLKE